MSKEAALARQRQLKLRAGQPTAEPPQPAVPQGEPQAAMAAAAPDMPQPQGAMDMAKRISPALRSAMAAYEDPEQFFEGVDQALRGLAEGPTIGYADEIAAFLDTLTGMGPGETFEENLAAQEQRNREMDPALRTMTNLTGAAALGGAVSAPRTAAQALIRGAGVGGAAGAGFAEGDIDERLKAAALGAGTGAVMGPATYGLANVIAPRASEAVQRLAKEGVRPTVGQIMGGNIKRIEEVTKSLPVAGGMVRGAEMRALEDFNRGAVNHALRPAGLTISSKTPIGRQVIAEADELLSKGYDDALGMIKQARVDSTFRNSVAQISSKAAARLGSKGQRAFNNAVNDVRSLPAMQKPTFSGDEIKRAIASLREKADKAAKNQDLDVSEAGLLLRELRDELSDLMKRNTTPENAARLTGLDRAYAGFQRVRAASEAARDTEGMFTPFQYSQAIKKAEAARGSREFARGGAMGQDLSSAAERVISSRVPDSGTPERLLPYALMAGAGAGYETGYLSPEMALLIGAAGLPYTRGGQNLIARLASRQASPGAQMLAESLRRSVAPVAAAGAIGATQ